MHACCCLVHNSYYSDAQDIHAVIRTNKFTTQLTRTLREICLGLCCACRRRQQTVKRVVGGRASPFRIFPISTPVQVRRKSAEDRNANNASRTFFLLKFKTIFLTDWRRKTGRKKWRTVSFFKKIFCLLTVAHFAILFSYNFLNNFNKKSNVWFKKNIYKCKLAHILHLTSKSFLLFYFFFNWRIKLHRKI